MMQHAAPLGIRFWDPALEAPVDDGLRVTLRPAWARAGGVSATRTGSGVYAFHNLPGLHGLEYGESDAPPKREYVLEAVDLKGRFLPVATEVQLPDPDPSLFLTGAGKERAPGPEPRFYLFSAPARAVTGPMAVVRAELWDQARDGPASWAVLEIVEPGGQEHFALADERGCAAALFPYPPLTDAVGGISGRLSETVWTLTVHVHYYRRRPLKVSSGAQVPDLRAIVRQRAGKIVPGPDDVRGADSRFSEITATLRYGEPLVLRTGNLPRLLIRSNS